MKWLNDFWISLGFKPHKSNITHFYAGLPIGLLFYLMAYYQFNIGYLMSFGISLTAGIIIASLKEYSDYSQRHVIKWKTWDWLDWIYTIAGSVTVPIIGGILILIL